MNGIFSPDSKFMQVLNRFADLMILNIIYVLTCIPVFTIGAATTALYKVCFQMGTEDEGNLYKGYFQAFLSNFKQATIIWIIIMLLGFYLVFYFFRFLQMDGALHYICIPVISLCIVMLMASFYVFPLLSQFQNKALNTLRNSLLFCLGYLPRTFMISAINLFPLVLLVTNLYYFMWAAFIWFTFYFAGAAYLNSRILLKVFSPYYSDEEDTSATA